MADRNSFGKKITNVPPRRTAEDQGGGKKKSDISAIHPSGLTGMFTTLKDPNPPAAEQAEVAKLSREGSFSNHQWEVIRQDLARLIQGQDDLKSLYREIKTSHEKVMNDVRGQLTDIDARVKRLETAVGQLTVGLTITKEPQSSMKTYSAPTRHGVTPFD